MGSSGVGFVSQSGGTVSFNGSNRVIYLGSASSGTGTYDLNGAAQIQGVYEYVGWNGTGIFNQSGGTNSISSLFGVGYNTGSNGTYELTSGLLQTSGNTVYVGYSGTGIVNQSSGTYSAASAELYLGYNAGSSGTYNLSGTGLLSAVSIHRIQRFGKRVVSTIGRDEFDSLSFARHQRQISIDRRPLAHRWSIGQSGRHQQHGSSGLLRKHGHVELHVQHSRFHASRPTFHKTRKRPR